MPEAYRQKFRNSTKGDGQTYVEFAYEKESLFDRWCTSQEVRGEYNKLWELLLIEEFKSCLSNEVKTYLDENKVETLHQAATLADDYTLESFLKSRYLVAKVKKALSAVRGANSQATVTQYNLRSNDKRQETK